VEDSEGPLDEGLSNCMMENLTVDQSGLSVWRVPEYTVLTFCDLGKE